MAHYHADVFHYCKLDVGSRCVLQNMGVQGKPGQYVNALPLSNLRQMGVQDRKMALSLSIWEKSEHLTVFMGHFFAPWWVFVLILCSSVVRHGAVCSCWSLIHSGRPEMTSLLLASGTFAEAAGPGCEQGPLLPSACFAGPQESNTWWVCRVPGGLDKKRTLSVNRSFKRVEWEGDSSSL